MNLAGLSIKRPIFITCLIILMIVAGLMAMYKMPVNLFPDVTFPIVTVTTEYRGAAPKEVELQVSKVIEEEISTVTGLKSLKSINKENVSIIVAEFEMSVDIKYAEQQVRDKVSSAKLIFQQILKSRLFVEWTLPINRSWVWPDSGSF